MTENTEQDTIKLLTRLQKTPKTYHGRETTISFVNEADFSGSEADFFNLPLGSTIRNYLKVQPSNESFYIYAAEEMAEKVLDLPKVSIVTAKVRTLFGLKEYVHWTDTGTIKRGETMVGLLIIELINVQSKDST